MGWTMSSSSLVVALSVIFGLAPDVPIQRPTAAPEAAAPAPEAPPDATIEPDAPTSDVGDAAPNDTPVETELVAPAEPVGGEADAVPAPVVDATPTPDLAAEYAAATIDLDDLDRKLRRAEGLIAGGSVMGIAGLVMLIGAATEAAKPACKFDQDTCANAPRPAVARGLGIGSAIAIVGGATMLGLGLHRRHKIRTVFSGDTNSVALTLHGRF